MDVPRGDEKKREVLRVADLNRRAAQVLRGSLGALWVEGEISGLRAYSSGHLYFTLKDADAQVAAVLFQGDRSGLGFEPADGQLVQAYGEVGLYEKRGQYQVRVVRMEPAGRGSLHEAFEKLKEKLQQEGLFDPARKRRIPALPQHIGVVTSPDGAAVRDILQVLERRYPNLHVLLAPTLVQGPTAAPSIARAIDYLGKRGGLDVIIVGRGGGSLEDLWPFNEEVVARAIAACPLPVISAVGHETDFTISDFVADLRAPTPSAAAELVVGRKQDFEKTLRERRRRLEAALRQRLANIRGRTAAAAGSYVFREPEHLLRRHRDRLDRLRMLAERALLNTLRERQQRLDDARDSLGSLVAASAVEAREHVRNQRDQLGRAAQAAAADRRRRLDRADAGLAAMSPLAVLQRGYSVTRLADGKIVRSVNDVQRDHIIETLLGDGSLESVVQDIRRNDHDGSSEEA